MSKAGETDRKTGSRKEDPDETTVEAPDAGGPDSEGGQLRVEPEERVETLEGELEDFEAQNAELLDALRRLKADFDNYRKRMLKEQTRILETAEAELVKKLLPVIDNLERALASAGRGEPKGLVEGVAKVLEMMLDTLKGEGLEVIDPQGEPFDPEHHEAMMVVETDECPEDMVTEVVQKGYRFGGVMLRPAMVKVSCALKA